MENLIYRDPLGKNEKFADWLNDLRNSSGAYVIRSKISKEILYVGESHTGRLANTIKRHFWAWSDTSERKHFTTFAFKVEIAVRVTPQKAAKGAQNNLIARLKPVNNTQGQPEEEKVF